MTVPNDCKLRGFKHPSIFPFLGCLRSSSPRVTLPAEAPGEGPSCLFQRLGAPGGPGLVAASLPALPPSSHGFSSVSASPLVSLRRTLSLDGGPPHPGGPPRRPFPWLLLCVFSVVVRTLTGFRAQLHPGGSAPWNTAPKTLPIP